MKPKDQVFVGSEMKIEKLPSMDEDMVKIINRILDQNEKIMAQNALLIEALSKPMLVIQ
jgi:hypothetical protein